MKILLAFITFVSLSANADVMGRLWDGKSVVCETKTDLGTSAYRASDLKVSRSGENIKIKVTLKFLVCQNTGWQPRTALQTLIFPTYTAHTVEYRIKQTQLSLITSDDRLVRAVAVEDKSVSDVTFEAKIVDLLGAAEKTVYDHTKFVEARPYLAVTSDTDVVVDGAFYGHDQFIGGIYYLKLALPK